MMAEQVMPAVRVRSMRLRDPAKWSQMWKRFMPALIERDGLVCQYCGCRLTVDNEQAGARPSIDHVLSMDLGGKETLENLRLCCQPCNSAKRERSLDEARHCIAVRALGWPRMTREVVDWMRGQGFDVSGYDAFRFYFERT